MTNKCKAISILGWLALINIVIGVLICAINTVVGISFIVIGIGIIIIGYTILK